MKKYQVVCIDDDHDFLGSLKQSLPHKVKDLCHDFGCEFDFASDPDELRDVISHAAEDGLESAMIISDQLMPRITGIELLEKIKAQHPDMVCVLLTGHAELDSARVAINKRLLDHYACKPIEDIQEFASTVSNLLKRRHLELEERCRAEQLAKTVEELRASNMKIAAMQSAAEQVARLTKNLKCLDFDEITRLAVHEVPKMFQAKWGALCFHDGLPEGCGDAPIVSREQCPAAEEFLKSRDDARQAVGDMSILTGLVPPPCELLGGKSPNVIIPLRLDHVGGEHEARHAYMCMCSMDKAMDSRVELMTYMGNLVKDILGTNLANAALYSIARADGETDSLTGVCTRRMLEMKLQLEHQRVMRYKRDFALVVVDVDDFKSVNDNMGHAAGDEVLRTLAKVMKGLMRASDTLARYGGDEFVWLMPETNSQKAREAVERLRSELRTTQSAGPVFTISCGISQWNGQDQDTAADILRRADLAMYNAKHAGKDGVEFC